MAQNKDGNQDSQDENEVKQWLDENDANGILARVIGDYDKFEDIERLFDDDTLKKQFDLVQHGQLVLKLLKKLDDYRKPGM